MCGIAGIISKKNGFSSISKTIAAMADALTHRGPDGEGFLFSDGQTAQPLTRQPFNLQGLELNYLPLQTFEAVSQSHTIAFAHRRLSILDLSAAGHEPMCDASGRLWITFNGEIYNYRELRDELRKAGHQFRSQCDTEVILYAYKEWGATCVDRFNGMWAFCILDLEKKFCFASRDRFGVKPFYYADHAGFFAFASDS